MYVWKHIKFKFVKETCYKVEIKSKMQILDIRYFDLKIISQNFTHVLLQLTQIHTNQDFMVWIPESGKLNYLDSRNIVALIMNAT